VDAAGVTREKAPSWRATARRRATPPN
jgi:hypothetical protein